MAEMTLIRANMLPTSSGDTHRLIKVRVATVVTGVNKAKIKPKIHHNWPWIKAGSDHPTAPVSRVVKISVFSQTYYITEKSRLKILSVFLSLR